MDLPGPGAAPADRVLVVDDNLVNRTLLVRMLEVLGVAADTAEDGLAAERSLTARGYAAVLMDVRMPGEDGLAVTAWLRARETGRRTPVIGVSAAQAPEDRQLCREAGMDDFLGKPVDLADLRRVVDHHLGRAGGVDAADASAPSGAAAPGDPVDVVDEVRLADLAEQLGDARLVHDTVRTYLSELPARRDALAAALADDDRDAVRLVAHSLTSSSAMLGAVALAAVCAELEETAGDGSRDEIALRMARVLGAAPTTAAALERWLGAQTGSNR